MVDDILVMQMSNKKELPVHLMKTHFIHILCIKGKASFKMENKMYNLKHNDIAILLPTARIQGFKRSNDFKAECLLVSLDLMSKNNPDVGWGIKGYMFSKEHPVVQLSEKDSEKCISNFEKLEEKYHDAAHRFRMQIVNLQLQMFVMDMWNIFSKEMERQTVSSHKGALFEGFLQLVRNHCMEEREVNFYSGKLFITAKYLTEICRKSSGKTASYWIENFTTQRLILLLENRSLSFTEIADLLNFSSQSFFTRYVRKVLGVTPSEFRRRMADE